MPEARAGKNAGLLVRQSSRRKGSLPVFYRPVLASETSPPGPRDLTWTLRGAAARTTRACAFRGRRMAKSAFIKKG